MAQHKISVLLLAGGKGARMQTAIPKQYLVLNNKPIARYSYDLFAAMEEISEIIVVCEPEFESVFVSNLKSPKIKFAKPGILRQDSVYSGLQEIMSDSTLVITHDSARPFIDHSLIRRAIRAGIEYGAATVGMPVKFTVKECDDQAFAKKTPERSKLWEIQTPQVMKTSLLKAGFELLKAQNLIVTDDMMLIEAQGHPVKLIEGSYRNIKITTPEDMKTAELFLN